MNDRSSGMSDDEAGKPLKKSEWCSSLAENDEKKEIR